VVRGVNTQAKTPQWMVDRLSRCGQRSVTALVDISNYVMFEYGRPTHIFDLDKIHGGLDVRWAAVGESLKLLNGNTVNLDDQVGIIADDSAVESLAGIMGGDATAVSDSTQNIYIEAAFWWPQAVAGRSRRFNFSTDAGHRFERGVDPSQTVEHLERITQLVLDICGTADTRCGPVDDHCVNLPVAKPVNLRVARAAKIIGMDLSQAQCVEALKRLGLPLLEGPGTVTVTPPAYRFDLVIEEDLIEEITRMVGYDKLPVSAPLAPITPKLRTESQRSRFAVRRALAALGYQETINFSFVEARWEAELAGNANPIRLLNPIASQMGVMRSSLLGSLLQSLKFNLDRKAERVRVFELGRVFFRDESVATTDATVKGIHQPLHVAGLIHGRADSLQWGRKEGHADFYDAKGDVEALLAPALACFEAAEHPAMHPGRCARIIVNGRAVGVVGELHPQWRQGYELTHAPVMFELELDAVLQREVAAFKAVSKFQAVQRDLAFIVPESVTFGALLDCVQSTEAAKGLLTDVLLFDVFRLTVAAAIPSTGLPSGGLALGEKSLALRLTLNSDTATLTDEQIESVMNAVVERAATLVGARLR
jgi:phenylalanyl-tRNA synthetase beta chain